MLCFENDYSEGAHPAVLQRLLETNDEQLPGYGTDRYCAQAAEKIKAACGCPNGSVYFLTGGTQTNATVIDALLARHEGVVCAQSGHINVHEAGAIEASGHKVLPLPQHDGKLCAGELRAFLSDFFADGSHTHMVFPGMVYLSHPTEYGTLYQKKELEDIAAVCREYGLPLYLDGARLGYGLASGGTDVTLFDVTHCCDVFYIGGTKVGALCGEAVVFPRGSEPAHFFTVVKQHGALLAKGRLLGVQFDALFTNDLYLTISRRAIETAMLLKKGLAEKGYSFYLDSPTNQQFVILENGRLKQLEQSVRLSFWEKYDDTHSVVRFATSWATTEDDVRKLLELL